MGIIRVATRKRYLVLDERTAADVSISLAARGLLMQLLNFPDNWKVNPKHLAKINQCGRDKIYSLLKELIERGYAVRNTTRNSGGKIIDHEYLIYERPVTENAGVEKSKEPAQNPLPENQEVDMVGDDRQTLLLENTEVAPLADLPDMAQPDTANQEGLTNTKNKLILSLTSNQEVRSKIPRDAIPVDNASFTPPENSKKLFQMTIDWYPRDVFLQVLSRAGLPPSHPWEDDLPEFLIYCIEHRQSRTQADWEDKLLATVLRNKHFHENAPKPIERHWVPTEQVWKLISEQGMNPEFARKLLPEFILYWTDTGDKKRSWSDTFVECVKHQWARRSPPLQTHATIDRWGC
jgi:hypothetical protein